jgi:hypothetical protein
MPSDFEMEDSDSSISIEPLNIDPSILASVTQGRPRVIFKGKEYQCPRLSGIPAKSMRGMGRSAGAMVSKYKNDKMLAINETALMKGP